MPTLPNFAPASPDDVLDYAFPVPEYLLAGETIAAASVVSVPAGLTIGAVTVATPAPVARIGGGVSGTRYSVVCSMTTSQGRAIVAQAALLIGPVGLDDPNLATPNPAT